MKKILLALALLVILVVIAFIKTERQDKQAQNAYNNGLQKGNKGLNQSLNEADSLRYYIGQQEVAFADSLMSKKQIYQHKADSLSEKIDSMALALEQSNLQKEQKKPKQETSSSASVSKKSKPKKPSRHEQILTAYKKRYETLSHDLSPREKHIAIAEIRKETASDFKITIAELNRIRNKNNINY
ncbi:MAG: hypothetical protein U9N55_01925 [candidate division Zixibacteria bacterium]|nr:hypothetical protein [candidate division Zixibacteria bacterium]